MCTAHGQQPDGLPTDTPWKLVSNGPQNTKGLARSVMVAQKAVQVPSALAIRHQKAAALSGAPTAAAAAPAQVAGAATAAPTQVESAVAAAAVNTADNNLANPLAGPTAAQHAGHFKTEGNREVLCSHDRKEPGRPRPGAAFFTGVC